MTLKNFTLFFLSFVLVGCAAADPAPAPEPASADAGAEEQHAEDDGHGHAPPTAPVVNPDIVQDAELLSWVSRAASYYPGSTWSQSQDEVISTHDGDYRLVVVTRASDSEHVSGSQQLLIDIEKQEVWSGMIASLPTTEEGITLDQFPKYLSEFLPYALKSQLRLKARVVYDGETGGAVVPFTLMIDTGYGEYRRDACYTADGQMVAIGENLPLDQDPVAYRKALIEESDSVTWIGRGEETKVEIVEFSDYECPSCARKWPMVAELLKARPGVVAHGMGNFPLTSIHTWAFRAASAGWCISQQPGPALKQYKELIYSLQSELELAQVTPTAQDFVVASGLDEAAFEGCYLKPASVSGIHQQLALGHAVGVMGTPTYIVNGWRVQVPEEEWFATLVDTLAKGEDPS